MVTFHWKTLPVLSLFVLLALATPISANTPGCCSLDQQTCSQQLANRTTPALCNVNSGDTIFFPNAWLADGAVANSTCLSNSNFFRCTSNSQCCGALVCGALAWSPAIMKCRAPITVCGSHQFFGEASCNSAPGCAWRKWNGRCTVTFNATFIDKQTAVNKKALKEPTLVKSQLDGNPDSVGLCSGFVGTVMGDPHVFSFDRHVYNCMGTGAYVLAKAEGIMEIQGLFIDAGTIEGVGTAAAARGIAVEYPGLPGVPRIQISMNETADRSDPTTYMINNDCAAHIFLDGFLVPARRNNSYSSAERSYVMTFTETGTVELQFFNGTKNSTAIQISTWGGAWNEFGCVMEVRTCLPLNEPELRNKTSGLLGTPNGILNDEWILKNGTTIPVAPSHKDQYKYCTANQCVMNEKDSLFVYEGLSFKQLWSCDGEYPGDNDLSEVPEDIAKLCQGRPDCLLEGAVGGMAGVLRYINETRVIATIQLVNKTVDEAKFDITLPVEDDCKWPRTGSNVCPKDVSLLNYPVTPLPLFVQSPINILSQNGNTVTFNISNPFDSKMQSMYYQFYNNFDTKCLSKSNLAACIKPITVTASCIPGRDAHHKETLKFTTVDFWFVDPTVVKPGDNYTIPACCQPDVKDTKVPTTLFTYKVYCESACPLSTSRRNLRN